MEEPQSGERISISESVEEDLADLKALKEDKPDLYATELGYTLASAVSRLSISQSNPKEFFRANKLLLGLVDMVDEVSQDRELAPVFANEFAAQLKASLSPEEK